MAGHVRRTKSGKGEISNRLKSPVPALRSKSAKYGTAKKSGVIKKLLGRETN